MVGGERAGGFLLVLISTLIIRSGFHAISFPLGSKIVQNHTYFNINCFWHAMVISYYFIRTIFTLAS